MHQVLEVVNFTSLKYKSVNTIFNSLYAGSFLCFCRHMLTFSKINFFSTLFSFFRNTKRESNGLDPDQDHHSVGPDLGLNRLQR